MRFLFFSVHDPERDLRNSPMQAQSAKSVLLRNIRRKCARGGGLICEVNDVDLQNIPHFGILNGGRDIEAETEVGLEQRVPFQLSNSN